MAVRVEDSEKLPEEEAADLRAMVVEDSEEAHTEPAEEETRVVVTTHVAPEGPEPGAALATTRQECCLMSAPVEITSRRQHTHMWAKVQGISKWSRWRLQAGDNIHICGPR